MDGILEACRHAKGADLLSEAEFLAIVESVRRKRRKQVAELLVA